VSFIERHWADVDEDWFDVGLICLCHVKPHLKCQFHWESIKWLFVLINNECILKTAKKRQLN